MPRCEQCNRDFETGQAFDQHNADKHSSTSRHEMKAIKKKEKEEKKQQEQSSISKKRKIKNIVVFGAAILGILGIAAFVIFLPKPDNDNVQIGPLGSTHIHADFAVYLNGKQVSFNDDTYFIGDKHNQYSHVHEPHSTLIHMHATGITIGYFMNAVGYPFNATCITLDEKDKLCNDGENTLKFYVNEKTNDRFNNYVIRNLDKILISYGSDTEEELKQQLDSVTSLATDASAGRIGG